MDIKFKVPQSAKKELNNIAKEILKARKKRESSIGNFIKSVKKKHNNTLLKTLQPLYQRLGELSYEYAPDKEFMAFVDQALSSIDEIEKRYKIELSPLKPTSKKYDFKFVDEHLNSVEKQLKLLDSLFEGFLDKVDKYKKDLDRLHSINMDRKKEIDNLSRDLWDKNNDLVNRKKMYRDVCDANSEYLFSEEKKVVSDLEYYMEGLGGWNFNMHGAMDTIKEISGHFDVTKSISGIDTKIQEYEKKFKKEKNKFKTLLDACKKSCSQGKIEWSVIKSDSDKLLKDIKVYCKTFSHNFTSLFERDGSKIVDDYKTYSVSEKSEKYLRSSAKDMINNKYVNISKLLDRCERICSYLDLRKKSKEIFFFDETNRSMNKNNLKNREVLSNPSKNLQTVYDIVFGGANIKQARYFINYPSWVLVGLKGENIKIKGVKNVYKYGKELKQDIAKAYGREE